MTRINTGVNPKYLTDEQLRAEHREIKRLPKVYLKSKECGSINRLPESFRLGDGRVLFFANKPVYTASRYLRLYAECIARGFKVKNYLSSWYEAYGADFFENNVESWELTDQCAKDVIDRITENIINSSLTYFHHYGKVITKQDAVELLKMNNYE